MTVPSSPPADRPGEEAAIEAAARAHAASEGDGCFARESEDEGCAEDANWYRLIARESLAAAYPIIAAALAGQRDEWRRCAEYAMHLAMYGENAPGGNETWREFEGMIRAAAARSGVSE